MRIGIFGGSFDPPHIGHIKIAQLSIKKVKLDKLILVPAGLPPHKDKGISDSKYRYAMCKAVANSYGFDISDYEIMKENFCYTADTIAYFASIYKEDELFFIAGGDSINAMDSWREPERIFARCNIIAASRISDENDKAHILRQKYNARIFWLDNKNIDISSTKIRDMVSNGKSIDDYVTAEVEAFIKENNLYR